MPNLSEIEGLDSKIAIKTGHFPQYRCSAVFFRSSQHWGPYPCSQIILLVIHPTTQNHLLPRPTTPKNIIDFLFWVERVARATLTNVATMGHVWASRQLRSVPLRSGSLRCVPLRYATHAPLRYATLHSTTLHLLRSLRSATLHYACAKPSQQQFWRSQDSNPIKNNN